MLCLRTANYHELEAFTQLQYQAHIKNFLSLRSLANHQKLFNCENISYLSIINDTGKPAGYFILHKEATSHDIQLKRILIDKNHLGIGQKAMIKLEQYCHNIFDTRRIWLDVFEDNKKACYIYNKLGYITFKHAIENNRNVIFYEKIIPH